jgi:hypothetical protein
MHLVSNLFVKNTRILVEDGSYSPLGGIRSWNVWIGVEESDSLEFAIGRDGRPVIGIANKLCKVVLHNGF